MQLKSLLSIFIFFTFIISVASDSVCKIPEKPLGPFSNYTKYKPIVQELKSLIEKNNWEADFEVAISDARMTGISEMVNIRNLTEYYNFLNHFVSWVPRED